MVHTVKVSDAVRAITPQLMAERFELSTEKHGLFDSDALTFASKIREHMIANENRAIRGKAPNTLFDGDDFALLTKRVGEQKASEIIGAYGFAPTK